MILHLHGFNQKQDNLLHWILLNKIELINNASVTMPWFDYNTMYPLEIHNTLQGYIAECKLIIGYSLGGFFAFCLAQISKIPTLIINPCLNPMEYLPKWTNGRMDQHILSEYGYLFDKYNSVNGNITCLIGERDDFIDHSSAKIRFPENQIITCYLTHNIEKTEACFMVIESAIIAAVDEEGKKNV